MQKIETKSLEVERKQRNFLNYEPNHIVGMSMKNIIILYDFITTKKQQ